MGSSITCWVCNQTSETETEVAGTKELPCHVFFNNSVAALSLRQKIARNKVIQCDVCIRGQPATSLCVECSNFQCEKCSEFNRYSREHQEHHTVTLKEIQSGKMNCSIQPKPTPMLCQEHGLRLNFYCETCQQLVCHYCISTQHRCHKHNSVENIASQQRAELSKIIEPIERMIDSLAKARMKVFSTQGRIGLQAAEVENQIDVYYNQLQQKLQQQRKDLKKELHEVSALNKKAISLQLEQIENAQRQLKNVKELGEAVQSGSDQEMLYMKKKVAEDVKRLTGNYNKLNTIELAIMEFIKEYEEKSFPFFGNIFYGDNSPFNTIVTHVAWPSDLCLHKEAEFTFSVVTKDRNRHPCYDVRNVVMIQAQSRTGDVISVPVKDHQDCNYTASFVPNQTGKVMLSLLLNGHLHDTRDFFLLSDPCSKAVSGMGYPWGIAFGKDGVQAVADHSNHCVYVFDNHDQLMRKFGSLGSEVGQFRSPCGLAFDAENCLYVVELCNHRVQKFDINGKYLLQFGSGNDELQYPVGIAVHNVKVFVADQGNRRISVFELDGQFINTFGSDQLINPYDVTFTDKNQILVADYGQHCISIFSLDGNYVGKIGTRGSDRGQLMYPSGVAVSLDGFIMVTEIGNHRLSVFDKKGDFLYCFGSEGTGTNPFSHPYGIACNPNCNIYVSDYSNRRILVFSDY